MNGLVHTYLVEASELGCSHAIGVVQVRIGEVTLDANSKAHWISLIEAGSSSIW